MKKTIVLTFLVVAAFALLLTSGCGRQSSLAPEKAPGLTLQFRYVDHPGDPSKILAVPGSLPAPGMNKPFSAQGIDLVRVMVIDLSRWANSEEFFSSEEFQAYATYRDSVWLPTTDETLWGEWEKLLGNYFQIVSNQTLAIESDSLARGTVVGAEGLNRILVALIQNGKIIYWGEGDAVGRKDETTSVMVEVWLFN